MTANYIIYVSDAEGNSLNAKLTFLKPDGSPITIDVNGTQTPATLEVVEGGHAEFETDTANVKVLASADGYQSKKVTLADGTNTIQLAKLNTSTAPAPSADTKKKALWLIGFVIVLIILFWLYKKYKSGG